MFTYSLAGLKLDESATGPAEVEESETTARSAVYQVLGHLFAVPDDDHYEKAGDGRWAKELAEASVLLPFPLQAPELTIPAEVGKADHRAEFERLFRPGAPDSPLVASAFPEADLEEVHRFYEYFGLSVAGDGDRHEDHPEDHLAVELDFMQYVCFKEAASGSPRLQGSFRRAQLEFLDHQLGVWVPRLVESAEAAGPAPFFAGVVNLLGSFVAADHEYVQEVLQR